MHLRRHLCLLGLISVSVVSLAQTVDLGKDHVPMTELAGPWRFHAGDNPAWSKPDFDDHDWSLLRTDQGWSEQGYKSYGGMGWYRLLLNVPPAYKDLAFFLPNVDESCEIYANGKLIGGVGSLPPNATMVQDLRTSFLIPRSALVSGRELEIAVRIWHSPSIAAFPGGGIYPPPRIGEASAIAEWRQLQVRDTFWQAGNTSLDLFGDALAALACLGLFLLRPREREYFWFGLNQAIWAGYQVAQLHFLFLRTPFSPWNIAIACLFVLGAYTGLEFICSVVGRQRRRWPYWAGIVFILALAFYQFYSVFHPASLPSTMGLWCGMGSTACLVVLLYMGVRAGNQDALLVLFPIAIQLANDVAEIVANHYRSAAWAQAFFRFEFGGIQWPFPLEFPQLLGDFETVAILIILIRRFARSRRDEERLEAELEAARIVQQVLVPAEIPPIPGFRIESVYRPAGQVGGDFFQIIPTETGGALVAVGDVSGKGLPAAMTVSLLVGTFRTLAHYTQNPAEILAAMNQRMLARSKDGFTTCLVLRTDKDGMLTFANAGHLAPFVNGEELKVENGLPLGLSADSDYQESTLQLKANDQLTVVTDGVVEARSKDGELFGFARTQDISCRPADEIARTAQSFGQEDDITVLTLACAGVTVAA